MGPAKTKTLGILLFVISNLCHSKSVDCGDNLKVVLGHVPHHFVFEAPPKDSQDPARFLYRQQIKMLEAFQQKLIHDGLHSDHAPFAKLHAKPTNTVFLLIHGLGGTPRQTLTLADSFFWKGHNVVSTILAGHGSKPQNLDRLAQDPRLATEIWESNIHQAYQLASQLGQRVVVVGFSMGGAIALNYLSRAHPRPKNLAAFVGLGLALKESRLARRHAEKVYQQHFSWLQTNNNSELSPFYWASPVPKGFENERFVNGEYTRIPTSALTFIPQVANNLELESRLIKSEPFNLEQKPVLLVNTQTDRLVDPEAILRFRHLFENHELIDIPGQEEVSHLELLFGNKKYNPSSTILNWLDKAVFF